MPERKPHSTIPGPLSYMTKGPGTVPGREAINTYRKATRRQLEVAGVPSRPARRDKTTLHGELVETGD